MSNSSTQQVLRVDSSARGEQSNSNQLSAYIWQQLQAQGAVELKHHDLGVCPLPTISAEDLVGIHGSLDLSGERVSESLKRHLDLSGQLIAEVKQADTLIIGAPLYNFGIPATLKQWIDYIARAGQTFRYTEHGPEGLSGVSEAYVVLATGGTPVGSDWDHASAYLRTVLAFIGVGTVHIIDVGGSKQDAERVLARARSQVDAILAERRAA